MVGVSTVKPSNTKFGDNLRSLLITNPWPNSWKYSVYKFCLDVMTWQLDRGKGFLVITPPDSGFAQILTWKKHQKTESNITLVVSMLTWPTIVIVILLSRTCVCTTIVTMISIWWNLSMPSAEKGSFGQIHSGRSYHHVCVHSLHTSQAQDICAVFSLEGGKWSDCSYYLETAQYKEAQVSHQDGKTDFPLT